MLASLPAFTGNAAAQQLDWPRMNKRIDRVLTDQTKKGSTEYKFAAIAVSAPERLFKISPITNTQQAAEDAAMQACQAAGGTNCQSAVWFRNACGALAFGPDGGWGASWGVDRREAERSAVEWCHRETTQCHVVGVQCTDAAR